MDQQAVTAGAPNESRAEVADQVVAILAKMVRRSPDSLERSTRLFEDLELDSTSALELLILIEDGIGVEFDEDTLEPEHFETVASLIAYVLEQLG
ncbi:acyl carrier protein [Nocardia sp. CA-128927]|uniref:acyl carrier protein n=1 Tax=Nocardia sp. CA-128927 TaxID=3239975 RepID=UPI003D9997B7